MNFHTQRPMHPIFDRTHVVVIGVSAALLCGGLITFDFVLLYVLSGGALIISVTHWSIFVIMP